MSRTPRKPYQDITAAAKRLGMFAKGEQKLPSRTASAAADRPLASPRTPSAGAAAESEASPAGTTPAARRRRSSHDSAPSIKLPDKRMEGGGARTGALTARGAPISITEYKKRREGGGARTGALTARDNTTSTPPQREPEPEKPESPASPQMTAEEMEREEARVVAMAQSKFAELDVDRLGVLTGVQLTQLTYWLWQYFHPAGVHLSKSDREATVKQMLLQLQTEHNRSRFTFEEYTLWLIKVTGAFAKWRQQGNMGNFFTKESSEEPIATQPDSYKQQTPRPPRSDSHKQTARVDSAAKPSVVASAVSTTEHDISISVRSTPARRSVLDQSGEVFQLRTERAEIAQSWLMVRAELVESREALEVEMVARVKSESLKGDLQHQVVELERELTRLQNRQSRETSMDGSELVAENEELLQENKDLAKQIRLKAQENETLQKRLAESVASGGSNDITRMLAEMDALRKSSAKMEEEKFLQIQESEDLRIQIRELELELQTPISPSTPFNLEELERQMELLEETNCQMKTDLIQVDKTFSLQISELKTANEFLVRERAEAAADFLSLKQQQDERDLDLQRSVQANGQLEESNAGLSSQCIEFQKEIEDWKSKLGDMEVEHSAFLQASFELKSTDSDQQVKQLAELKGTIAGLEAKLKASNEEIGHLKEQRSNDEASNTKQLEALQQDCDLKLAAAASAAVDAREAALIVHAEQMDRAKVEAAARLEEALAAAAMGLKQLQDVLEERIAALEAELTSSQTENAQLVSRHAAHNELQQEVEHELEEKLGAANEEICTLRAKLAEAATGQKAASAVGDGKLSDLQDENHKLKQALDDANTKLASGTVQVQQLIDELAKAKEALQHLHELEQNNDVLDKARCEEEKMKDAHRGEADLLKVELERLTAEIVELNQAHDVIDQERSRQEQKVKSLQLEFSIDKETNDKLVLRIEELESLHALQEGENAQQTAQIEKLQEEIGHLKEQHSRDEASFCDLVASSNAKLKQLEEDHSSLGAQIAVLKARIGTLEAELTASQAANSQLISQLELANTPEVCYASNSVAEISVDLGETEAEVLCGSSAAFGVLCGSLFQLIDADGSGQIDKSEMRVFVEAMGCAPPDWLDAATEQLIEDGMDTDGNDLVSRSEFAGWLQEQGISLSELQRHETAVRLAFSAKESKKAPVAVEEDHTALDAQVLMLKDRITALEAELAAAQCVLLDVKSENAQLISRQAAHNELQQEVEHELEGKLGAVTEELCTMRTKLAEAAAGASAVGDAQVMRQTAQIEKLQEEIGHLKEQHSKDEASFCDLVASSSTKLKQLEEDHAALVATKVASLLEQIEALEAELKASQAANAQLVERQAADSGKLQDEIEHLKEQHSTVLASSVASDKSCSMLSEELEDSKEDQADIKAERDRMLEKAASLLHKIAALEASLSAMTETNRELEDVKSFMSSEGKAMMIEIRKLKMELASSVQPDESSGEDHVIEIRGRGRGGSQSRSRSRGPGSRSCSPSPKNSIRSNDMKKLQGELERAAMKIGRLEMELKAAAGGGNLTLELEQQLAERLDECESSQMKLDSQKHVNLVLVNESKAVQLELDAMKAKYCALESTNTVLTLKLEAVEGQGSDPAEVKELQEANADLRAELYALKTQLSSLNNELDELKLKPSAKGSVAVEDGVADLEQKVVELGQENARLQVEIEHLKEQHSTVLASSVASDKSCSVLSEGLEDSKEDQADIKAERDRMLEKAASLLHKIAALEAELVAKSKTCDDLADKLSTLENLNQPIADVHSSWSAEDKIALELKVNTLREQLQQQESDAKQAVDAAVAKEKAGFEQQSEEHTVKITTLQITIDGFVKDKAELEWQLAEASVIAEAEPDSVLIQEKEALILELQKLKIMNSASHIEHLGLSADFSFGRRVYQCIVSPPGVGYRFTPVFADKNKNGCGPQEPQCIIADGICQGPGAIFVRCTSGDGWLPLFDAAHSRFCFTYIGKEEEVDLEARGLQLVQKGENKIEKFISDETPWFKRSSSTQKSRTSSRNRSRKSSHEGSRAPSPPKTSTDYGNRTASPLTHREPTISSSNKAREGGAPLRQRPSEE